MKRKVYMKNAEENLKVCLVTWYGSNNYGTNLQAYALYTVLRSKGIHVDMIRPFCGRKKFHQYPGQQRELRSKCVALIKKVLGIRKPEQVRQTKIMKFLKNEFCFTPLVTCPKDIELLNKQYDKFLTGSDQIWNPYNLDTFYMLDFVKENQKKIAYSSSIAVSRIPEEKQNLYKKYLSSFSAIFCREETGSKMLSALTGKTVKTVLDPVLLLDENSWIQFSHKGSLVNRISVSIPYIFCYFIGDKDFEWKALKTIKEQYGINRVIVFSVAPPTCKIKGYEYLQSADIYDFVWFLHHATYVVTDSFHNVAMSLKLKKDFVALMRCKEDQKSENSRMYDFLASFGLEFKIREFGIRIA